LQTEPDAARDDVMNADAWRARLVSLKAWKYRDADAAHPILGFFFIVYFFFKDWRPSPF
jgi:hypothetical protein